MVIPLQGIHHITAIARNPQRNLDFYTHVMGLRLVKQTVNFDDPGTYHFYFGDASGTPGTILTFFPYPQARPSQRGMGQIASLAFAIPPGTLDFWRNRLAAHGLFAGEPFERFGDTMFTSADPDGTMLEFVVSSADQTSGTAAAWHNGTIPVQHAIQRLRGVTLWVRDSGPTRDLLTGVMEFAPTAQDGSTTRYQAGTDPHASVIDVTQKPHMPPGRSGAGHIHHVAWRVTDDAAQAQWHSALTDAGVNVTPVRDRQYFRSLYFFEPGGSLFEIATDIPGFAIDESQEALGQRLQLPDWLEGQRDAIIKRLPELTLPSNTQAAR